MSRLLQVTRVIERANPVHPDYPLLPGDVLTHDPSDGTYTKHAPGLAVCGFVLTAQDLAALVPVEGRVVLGSWADVA